MQRLGCAAGVDGDAVGVEGRAAEGGVDDVRRAVQALRRPEHLAAPAVGASCASASCGIFLEATAMRYARG
ncbi:MAG TPA: hypothetical protein VI006_16095 [Solirubrobacteraceae bacterium]